MRILVKHYLVEKLDELPDRKVTVEVVIPEEAGGEDVQGPIDLTLGQQLTLEVAASEFEYPGGGIEGCFPAISDTQIQAVLDTDEERQERRRVEERRGRDEGPPTDAELLDRADRRVVEGRYARPEARAAQLLQIRAALEMVVGELRGGPLSMLGLKRLADGLQELLDGNAALRDDPSPAEAITPEEARTLHAVWAGDAFDAQFLESVQPKLEAIAGESWR